MTIDDFIAQRLAEVDADPSPPPQLTEDQARDQLAELGADPDTGRITIPGNESVFACVWPLPAGAARPLPTSPGDVTHD